MIKYSYICINIYIMTGSEWEVTAENDNCVIVKIGESVDLTDLESVKRAAAR